jgi:hypothetical protein
MIDLFMAASDDHEFMLAQIRNGCTLAPSPKAPLIFTNHMHLEVWAGDRPHPPIESLWSLLLVVDRGSVTHRGVSGC